MGKVKRDRQKFHITLTDTKVPVTPTRSSHKDKPALRTQLDAIENIFAGINIQLDSLNKFVEPETMVEDVERPTEPEFVEKKTNITAAIVKPNIQSYAPDKHVTKKEKMRLKHEKLMQKLDVVAQARAKSSKSKQKNKLKQADQSLLPSKAAVKSLLTPAAVRPQPNICETSKKAENQTKNVFAIPTFNDDLPSLNSIFKLKPAIGSKVNTKADKLGTSNKIIKSSKKIAKEKKKINYKLKDNFVQNCNMLKKLMAKNKNK